MNKINALDNISILIVEDHPMVRFSYKTIVAEIVKNANIEEANSVEEANNILEKSFFDVAIIDLNLNDKSGFSIIKKIKNLKLSTKIIVISLYDDIETIWLTKKLKANAFIPKTANIELFTNIFNKVLVSNDFITTEEKNKNLFNLESDEINFFLKKLSLLTQKERLVFKLKLGNHKNSEISNILSIKQKSVENYVNRISDKCIPVNYTFSEFVEKHKVALPFILSFVGSNNDL